MNAQGGPIVEEDDEINRDWLDWTYSAATFSVFLSILYFYSSLSRFLMVMGATVVMYLHHVGWFPFRPRLVQNFPNDGPPPDVVNQDPNNNLQEGTDPETEDPNHLPPDRDVLDGEQTSPSFMSTAWLVFKTFFASLLPEGPQPSQTDGVCAVAAGGFDRNGLYHLTPARSPLLDMAMMSSLNTAWRMICFCDQAKAET